jgi:hypothetical protein
MPTNNFPGIGYTKLGYERNFFQIVAVTATTFGGGSVDGYQPDLIITFNTQGIQFLNLGTGIVEFSFNGNTVHGQLNSADLSSGLTFDNRVVSKVWLRVKAGSSGPINVSVNAWSAP